MGTAAVRGLDPAEHAGLAWSIAARYMNVADPESVVAAALLALVRVAPLFDPGRGCRPSTFLGPVLVNACRDEWRRQRRVAREVPLYVVTAEGEEMERPDLPAVEPVAEERVLAREVREAVERLPERERLIVERRYGLRNGEPATAREVGEVVGLSQQRVAQIGAKAESRLRKEMTPHLRIDTHAHSHDT